jgi:ribonuclease BN (tRNA processing enzyme)
VRLTVLGSGDAFSGCGCNAAYVIDGRILVDCGAPAHVLLGRAGSGVTDLQLALVTHVHADHTFMLPLLLGAYAMSPHDDKPGLTVAGPAGTKEYVHRLIADGYGTHLDGMIAQRSKLSFAVLQDGSDCELAGYRVRAHAVVHSTGPSLAYAVTDERGTTVGFSGDSAMCAGLTRCLAQCDCFVCECTGWDGPVPGGHLWRDEVEKLVAGNPEVRFVLSHLPERRPLAGAIIAHDLLTLEVRPR